MQIGDEIMAILIDENGSEWSAQAKVVHVALVPNGYHQVEWFDGTYEYINADRILCD